VCLLEYVRVKYFAVQNSFCASNNKVWITGQSRQRACQVSGSVNLAGRKWKVNFSFCLLSKTLVFKKIEAS
jgi:hypothetical protein